MCVWVGVGSHTNWTGVVVLRLERHSGWPQSTGLGRCSSQQGLPCRTFDGSARMARLVGPEGLGAWIAFLRQFGQLREQGRWAGTRVWQVWRLDGCGAVIRRPRSGEDPTHTQNWNGGLTGLPLCLCVCVKLLEINHFARKALPLATTPGGWQGARVRFMATRNRRVHTHTYRLT